MSCFDLVVEATESIFIQIGRFSDVWLLHRAKIVVVIRRTWKSIVRLAKPRMGRDGFIRSRSLDGCGAWRCECIKAAECIKAELRR